MQTVIEPSDVDVKKYAKLPIIDAKNPGRKLSEKEEKWLREMRTYEFTNREEPGLSNTFPYGAAGKSMKFTFFHGGKYRIPRFIANHVNNCGKPIYGWRPNGQGGMEKQQTGTESRFQMREVFE